MMRQLRSEHGFTLPELLVGMLLMLVVGFAALLAAQTMQRTTDLADGRQRPAAEARVALQRMTRDIREATQVVVSSSTTMDALVPTRGGSGATRHVQWSCSTSCVRRACSTAIGAGCTQTGSAYTLGGVTNADVFTPRNGQTALALPASVSASNLGATSIDFVELHLRLRVDRRTSGSQTTGLATHPDDFRDGADLAQYAN